MNVEERLWTAEEVATYCGLSKKTGHITVKKWIKQGKIKACWAGDLPRFRKRDIDDFTSRKR